MLYYNTCKLHILKQSVNYISNIKNADMNKISSILFVILMRYYLKLLIIIILINLFFTRDNNLLL